MAAHERYAAREDEPPQGRARENAGDERRGIEPRLHIAESGDHRHRPEQGKRIGHGNNVTTHQRIDGAQKTVVERLGGRDAAGQLGRRFRLVHAMVPGDDEQEKSPKIRIKSW